MSDSVSSIRGMHDLLPESSHIWQHVEACVRDVMRGYGYLEMRTPVLERSSLFHRGIGEATDIVEKEMYTFPDRKGESLSLRPENTASCVRAALQHGLMANAATSRIWYLGPMFRYERPQRGRTRQFHQAGAEVYGVGGPAIEAELIVLSSRLWKALGIDQVVRLELNTLGTSTERAAYRQQLVEYFKANESQLDADSEKRLLVNPLRILDSKNPQMQSLIEGAPSLTDSLGSESTDHFEQLQHLLRGNGIEPILNPRLVRGLDYYSHSVWEWTTDLLGAQATVCGGGRYDGLVEELGGKPSPAVGWALGMERLIELVTQVAADHIGSSEPDAYLLASKEVDSLHALQLAELLRDSVPGCSIIQDPTGGSLKSQFKRADKSGAGWALVLGADEIEGGFVTVKPLRSTEEQRTLKRDELAEFLRARMAGRG